MRIRLVSLLVTAATIGVMQSASAADMPVKAPVYKAPATVVAYNWTGPTLAGTLVMVGPTSSPEQSASMIRSPCSKAQLKESIIRPKA